jgi:hypothetical protein
VGRVPFRAGDTGGERQWRRHCQRPDERRGARRLGAADRGVPATNHGGLESVRLRTYLPDDATEHGTVTVSVDGVPVAKADVGPGLVDQTLPVRLEAHRQLRFGFDADWSITPGTGPDRRIRSFILVGLVLEEAAPGLLAQ